VEGPHRQRQLDGGNLTDQVRNIAAVTTSVANGDLSKKITADARGRDPRAEGHDQHDGRPAQRLRLGGDRVAREVGTDGKLGGQAKVSGVSGTWKDLTDKRQLDCRNLTSQVRNIAAVTTAVANGDLSKKITADASGEIMELKETINTMVGPAQRLRVRGNAVAREVGTEGKLGGQARVSGVVRDVEGPHG
jgi:HAMP domain-containing protein